jgi:acyl CoA:acetate/3-ketoacid CoA transferase
MLLRYAKGEEGMKASAARFQTILEVDVPKSRRSKHRGIVAAILKDLDQLKPGSAFKVPLKELGDSKANVRSALNRATRKANRKIATATDEEFLYVWNVD